MSDLEALMKFSTIDELTELEYLTAFTMESMRFQSPAPATSMYFFKEDVTIKGIKFEKGTKFYPYIHGLHHNSREWQKPQEFLPERFIMGHELSLTSDGKKRNPYSFLSFHGG